MTPFRFRIRQTRGKWRVESLYPEGWAPAYTGCMTADEAREFFATAAVLRWDDETRLSGEYLFT